MNRSALSALSALSVLLLTPLAGCGSGFDALIPTVRFQRLDVTALSFEAIDVDFVFDVDNPNPIGIPLERFSYALGFEGIEFISGDNPDGLRLEAEGSSEIALPLSLDFQNIFDTVEATRGLDYIGFGLQGAFGFDTDFGPVDIGYEEEGSFPALRAPRITLGDLALLDADGSEVGFGLGLNIDNEHGSNLDFSDLAFTMNFAGARVGRGDVADVGSVPGASTGTLTIPFVVDYADAIDAVVAASSGQALDVELDAEVSVNTPFGLLPLTIDERGDVEVNE